MKLLLYRCIKQLEISRTIFLNIQNKYTAVNVPKRKRKIEIHVKSSLKKESFKIFYEPAHTILVIIVLAAIGSSDEPVTTKYTALLQENVSVSYY